MKIYPHPSDGKPVFGAVVFEYRGHDISLSNLFGAGEIRVFERGASSGKNKDITEIIYSHLLTPTSRNLRNIMNKIDALLGAEKF